MLSGEWWNAFCTARLELYISAGEGELGKGGCIIPS